MGMAKKGVAGAKLAGVGAKPATKPESDAADTAADETKTTATKTRTAPPPVADHSESPDHDDTGHEAGEEAAATPSKPAGTRMAPRSTSTDVATRPSAGGALTSGGEASEPDGFEDLDNEIGFGSFPIMKLDNGSFSIGDDEIGTSVLVIMQQSRAKHLYKEGGKEETDYVVYSYDEKNDTGGRPLESVFAEWASEGVDVESIEHKKYSEAVALVVQEGEYYGQLVLLSVPPASIKRMAGYRAELKVMKRTTPQQVVTRCEVGKKVKKDNKSFTPWQFRFVRKVTQEELDSMFSGLDGEEEAGEAASDE